MWLYGRCSPVSDGGCAPNATGSTAYVNFTTSKRDRWETDARRCHVNWVILDSDWEAEFCRVAEAHPKVIAYVKNHNLGLEVPYRYGSQTRKYLPDFEAKVEEKFAEMIDSVTSDPTGMEANA